MGKKQASTWRHPAIWIAVAGVVALCWWVRVNSDDGKDWSKGGQRGAWSAAERDEATSTCRKYASAYRVSPCRVSAFCRCAVSNYEGRGSFREFRDSLAPAVASYIRPGASGYFCTAHAASECSESE